MSQKLPLSFYTNENVVEVARNLIGCRLYTQLGGVLTGGIIVETEAYNGRTDKACHAFPEKRTERTSVMYEQGGVAYVYFVYGMHYLFNIVTHKKGFADAVLIRAIEPLEGVEEMMLRRGKNVSSKLLTGGPARLSEALGIDKSMNGLSLLDSTVWVEEPLPQISYKIGASTRIGVDYAGEDALLPWRFYAIGNKFVSK
ncbi:MAG: DNA-3-methyladenine glycosylase [Cyclobacteriaceae bacterium]|nr:DNA-3-methyladenine glycosylase [Cyclobacteriaceae bacterium]